MRITSVRIATGALPAGVLATLVALPGAAPAASPATSAGVKTHRPPLLAPLRAGVRFDPILSTGDIVGGRLGGYQMSGTPDGLGFYRSAPDRIELFMNHELDGAAPAGVGTRVSHLTLDRSRRVHAAQYVVSGREGFLRFCSATLGRYAGVPWFTTGEESTDQGAGPAGGHGGTSIAINAKTGRRLPTPHFGRFAHENVVPLRGLKTTVVVSGEDGDAGHSQLYAYTAATFNAAVLGRGQLWVWKANRRVADGNPSTNDIAKGQTLRGHFVAVSQAENRDADSLEAAAQAKGAFDFVRVEDVAQSVDRAGVVYFADTGSDGAESHHGRIYRLRVDPTHPARADLTVVLDGDAGDNIVNPDNLDVSRRAMLIQEDRNSENRGPDVRGGYGRVLAYDLRTRVVRPVARVATPSTLSPGSWESSGVVNAAGIWGSGWWLLDVQAHDTERRQPGLSLRPNAALGEDGQLLAMYVPGT